MDEKMMLQLLKEEYFEIPSPGGGMKVYWDDGLAYLPLFYFLPKESVEDAPQYMSLPRNFVDVLHSEEALKLIRCKDFVEFVQRKYASWFWSSICVPGRDGVYRGIPGSWDYYSEDFPLWRIVIMLAEAAKIAYRVYMGHNFVRLFTDSANMDVNWTSLDHFVDLMGRGAFYLITVLDFQPVIDAVWETRQFEDYDGESLYKQDFSRSWYHNRTVETISFDEMMETGAKIDGETLYEMEDPRSNFEKNMITQCEIDEFKETLNEQDKKILDMRYQDYTCSEIAKELGYKTASAVSKRIHGIARKYDHFVGKRYNEFLDERVRA